MPRTLVKTAGLLVLGLGLALIAFYIVQTIGGYIAGEASGPPGGAAPTTEAAADDSAASSEDKTPG